MFLIDSGEMHNFVSAELVQQCKLQLMCVTMGNKLKVLSTTLAKLSISCASRAAQMVWCHIVLKLSALVIIGMDYHT